MEKQSLFISHTQYNDKWLHTFVQTLRDAGYPTWFDETDLEPGQNITETISTNLQNRVVLVIVTPEVQRSEWMAKEVLAATARGVEVIPVIRAQAALHGLLSNLRAIDVMSLDGFSAAQRVIGGLQILAFEPRLKQKNGVFISHSSEDKIFVSQFVADIERAGISVWVDIDGIQHGDFYRRINEGLGKCKWLVLVVTPKALSSEVVRMEVDAAINLKVKGEMSGVIPFVAQPFDESTMPPIWRILHRYDAIAQGYEVALAGLLKALQTDF